MRNLAEARRPRLWRGRSGEAGGAGTELAGVVIVAALLLSASLAAAPGVGQRIVCGIGSSIAAVVDGSWSCEAPGGEDSEAHMPTEPCTVSQTSHQVSAGLDATVYRIVSAGIGGNAGIVIEQLSDGTYRVTSAGGGHLNGSVGVGIGPGSVTIDGQKYGAYAGAAAGVKVGAGGGVSYTVGSAEEAEQLASYLAIQRAGTANPVAGLVADMVTSGYQPPPPNEVYVELTNEVYGQAEATQVTTSASANANRSQALGMKINFENNTVTTYYRVTVNGGVQGNHGAVGASARGSAEMLVAVTVDADDSDKVLNISASGMAEGSAEAGLPFYDVLGVSAGQQYTASLDLNSSEVQDIGMGFLEEIGVVPGNSYGGLQGATNTFMEAVKDRGVLTRQDVDKETSNNGFNGNAGVVGFGAEYVHEQTTFSNGEYWDGNSWQPWEGC